MWDLELTDDGTAETSQFIHPVTEEGSTSQMEFLGRPNQLVRAVQLDVNPN